MKNSFRRLLPFLALIVGLLPVLGCATQDGGLRVVLADQLPPELLAQATPLKPQS